MGQAACGRVSRLCAPWLSLSEDAAVFVAVGLCFALFFLILYSFSISVFFKIGLPLESNRPGLGSCSTLCRAALGNFLPLTIPQKRGDDNDTYLLELLQGLRDDPCEQLSMVPAGSKCHPRLGWCSDNNSYPMWWRLLFKILPSFISPSLCKFLPFVSFLFSPPSFFLPLFYLFFLTGYAVQLIFKVLVIFELSVRFPNLNCKSLLVN